LNSIEVKGQGHCEQKCKIGFFAHIIVKNGSMYVAGLLYTSVEYISPANMLNSVL